MNPEATGPERVTTVAICTRNRAETLGDCIASVIAQDLPTHSYEILVVDDGSTDETHEIVRRFASNEPPVVRYHPQNYGGLSSARNRAVTEGRGELICFIDDDAVATPSWLRAMVGAAERNPGVECFGGRLLLRLEGKPPRTCGRESLGASLDLGEQEIPTDRVRGANFAVRRSAFEILGLFNEALVWRGDEDNWTHRLLDSGGEIMYVPDALVWHRRTAEDLKLRNLLKTRFGWGVGKIQYLRETEIPFDPILILKHIRKDLSHACFDRCSGGLLNAVVRMGQLWAATYGELRRPKHEAPSLSRSAAQYKSDV